MQLYKKLTSVIGLDIGTSMIKAVKMTTSGKTRFVESYALEPLEEGTVQAGEIRNPSALASAVSTAVHRCDPSIDQVVVALPAGAIVSEILTMNLTPDKQMREAVLIEAAQVSAFDLNDVEIDYAVLERDESSKKMRVLMVVAKNDLVLAYMDFLGEAGLQATIVDVDLFALTNVFHLNYDTDQITNCVLLNIGSENTVAAFLKSGVYHSSRDINVAGDSFLNEVKLLSSVPADKYHAVLRGSVPADLDADEVADALNRASNHFASAVNVALSYFQASVGNERIDLIVLTGGYAWVPGLINVLELQTGAEVIILNPFNKIPYAEGLMDDVEIEKMGSVLSVAVGLATRTI